MAKTTRKTNEKLYKIHSYLKKIMKIYNSFTEEDMIFMKKLTTPEYDNGNNLYYQKDPDFEPIFWITDILGVYKTLGKLPKLYLEISKWLIRLSQNLPYPNLDKLYNYDKKDKKYEDKNNV